ncbi:MAG: TMEM165/GDT1 family protein [Anaerolineae bacterium]|nr:TMEM165/GDT1 family protein [Anaerolineae bacterium]
MDWKVLWSTLGLLFLAELGDKTQLAVISMVCKTEKPVPVFLGAVAALALVTLIGVVAGGALTQVIPPHVLQRIAAVLFVVMGVLMWFDVL